MRILITGGAGYIGTQTVEELAKDPKVSEIVVYDNLSHGRHGLFFGDRILRFGSFEGNYSILELWEKPWLALMSCFILQPKCPLHLP